MWAIMANSSCSLWAGKRKPHLSNRAESQSFPPLPHTVITSMRKWTMSALLLSTACMRGLWPLLMSLLTKKKAPWEKSEDAETVNVKFMMSWNLVIAESVQNRDWPLHWCQLLHPAAFWPSLCGHAAQPDGEGSNLKTGKKQKLKKQKFYSE